MLNSAPQIIFPQRISVCYFGTMRTVVHVLSQKRLRKRLEAIKEPVCDVIS
jgi:hypothetical protein